MEWGGKRERSVRLRAGKEAVLLLGSGTGGGATTAVAEVVVLVSPSRRLRAGRIERLLSRCLSRARACYSEGPEVTAVPVASSLATRPPGFD